MSFGYTILHGLHNINISVIRFWLPLLHVQEGWLAGAYGIRILKCLSVCEARFQQPEIAVFHPNEGERGREGKREKKRMEKPLFVLYFMCVRCFSIN